jgi:dynein heavy chain
MNPKSITMGQLYGSFDDATHEWSDGILCKLFREAVYDTVERQKWVVFDGPVDALWIESMNTVMDDNKTLTLINGDRIGMSETMSLLFECQDLAVASPATVSRAGMVYIDEADLGWAPFVATWLARSRSGATRCWAVKFRV